MSIIMHSPDLQNYYFHIICINLKAFQHRMIAVIQSNLWRNRSIFRPIQADFDFQRLWL